MQSFLKGAIALAYARRFYYRAALEQKVTVPGSVHPYSSDIESMASASASSDNDDMEIDSCSDSSSIRQPGNFVVTNVFLDE